MSLLKHLLLSVSLAITVILVGTVWLSVDSARAYLSAQLQAQSDSAATSLALTLSQPFNQDPVTQELLITALYDTGQFYRIELFSAKGELVVSRVGDESLPTIVRGAPAWFSEMLPLRKAVAMAQVSDGWRQTGRLVIEADAGQARDTLWASFMQILMVVLIAGLVWAFFVWVLMRWLRQALREEVEARVEGMLTNKVQIGNWKRARFSELREVTRTIDEVREKVMVTQQEQSTRIESLQLELHQDEVTGLANRKYFINEMRRVLDVDKNGGYVLLFRQRDLAAINTIMTRANVDNWLRNVGEQVSQVFLQDDRQPVQLARLNGSDFVVLLPNLEGPDIAPLTDMLLTVLARLRVQLPSGQFCRWALALTDYRYQEDIATVLSRLDRALMRAESSGHNTVEFVSRSDDGGVGLNAAGETQWRQLLQEGLAERRFLLSVRQQPDHLKQNSYTRYEATLMLRHTGHSEGQDEKPISAYLFMPVAARLGLSAVCDLRAVELALEWLADNQGDLVIRMSLPTIVQPRFLQEIQSCLSRSNVDLSRLYIELDAYGVEAHGEEVEVFCLAMKEMGVRVGLRRLLEHIGVLRNLQTLQLSYVSFSTDVIKEMVQSPGGMELLVAASNTCARLGVQIQLNAPITEIPIEAQKILRA